MSLQPPCSRFVLRLCTALAAVWFGPTLGVVSAYGQPAAYGALAGGIPERPLFAGVDVTPSGFVDADAMYVEPLPPTTVSGPVLLAPAAGASVYSARWWTWQLLPDGLIYRSYLAGPKEPRLAAVFINDLQDSTWALDATVGGRVGLIRFGAPGGDAPEGWQLDAEAAAFPRINIDEEWDVDSADFRYGFPLTYGQGPYRAKIALYHLSAHMGDEFIIRNPGALASRINYTRDAVVLGGSYYPLPEWRLYAEAGYAFHTDDGSEPWEFQFGVEYASCDAGRLLGAPFLAINAHLRQEVDFGGELTAQTGWQWRGPAGHTFRTGVHFQTGKTNQYEFFTVSETQLGWGVWYDY